MSRTTTRASVYHRDDASRKRDVEHVTPQVSVESTPEPAIVQRLACVGGSTWDYIHPTAYAITQLQGPVKAVTCESMSQYEVGCHVHHDCYGHLSLTPCGIVVVPGTLARRTTDNRNQFNELAVSVFQRSTRRSACFYQDALRSMMLGKRGQIRGSMESTSIEGSARLVIVPCWDLEYNQVCIPLSMASNFRVATTMPRDGDARRTTYGETSISSGDWVLMVRPPSLSHTSVQPFRVKLWERPCIGLYPGRCPEFHADYDGDEMQMYHLSDPESVAECEAWCPVAQDPFIEPGRRFRELTCNATGTRSSVDSESHDPQDRAHRNKFMEASNMSMEEIMCGTPYPYFTRESRMKPAMMSEFAQRGREDYFKEYAFRYVAASVAGQSDVARQQLSQGRIGDVSRQARLAASCFKVLEDGTVVVAGIRGLQAIGQDSRLRHTRGNVMLRGINTMCGRAQQALLDSHRAGISQHTARNLIEDVLQGSDVGVYVLPPSARNWASAVSACEWVTSTAEHTVALVQQRQDHKVLTSCAIGLLSPWSLEERMRHEVTQGSSEAEALSVCRRLCYTALCVVCNHCDVELSDAELVSVTWMLTYKPEVSPHPVTSRIGFAARDLRSLVDVAVNHFGRFYGLCSRGNFDEKVEISTVVENLILGGEFIPPSSLPDT